MPKISVLLPVYNADVFLARTLDSLLCQTDEDFEIIAINDGSTDDSLKILNEYAGRDKRIKVTDQKNIGLVKTLNKAVSLSKGEFLARMDSDDLSLPRRFELQMRAFAEHPSAVLVAGSFDVMNEDDDIIYREHVPTEKEELKRALSVRNPIAHGSVMLKRSAFDEAGNYSDECGPTEDYELWSRLIDHGDFVAVPATIFRWRINPEGITQNKANAMEAHMRKNIARFLSKNPLQITSRSYLMKRGQFYINTYELHGVGMKEAMLKDCISVAIAFARSRSFLKALKQLFIVASTGRTGIRLTFDRLKHTTKHHVSKNLIEPLS